MISLNEFFALNTEIILFIYGLGFFILGFAIILQIQQAQSSRLELARSLRWLAAFGITHAFNEWADLFIPIQARYLSPVAVKFLLVVQLLLLAISFACLFEFGASLLQPVAGAGWLRGAPAIILGIWGFLVFFILLPTAPDLEIWDRSANALARYFIALPGGLLAAYGLRVHAIRRIKPLNVPIIFQTLQIAGISIGIYAILAGLITPPVPFFPGNLLNTQIFLQTIGLPIIILRGFAAILVTILIIRSLEVFSLETQRKIEQLEQQQIINAEHERLARELHDGAIQKVYTAGLLVESAARLAEPGTPVGVRLERSVNVLNDAIGDLRRNLSELHAGQMAVSDVPFPELLQQLADDPHYNLLVSITLEMTLSGEKSLSPVRTGHVIAILNEALANIVRHANARNVHIEARDLGNRLLISLKDDGIGFTTDAQPGYGVRNMRDRSRLVNGDIQFSGQPGKGTTITLEIPWVDK
jgi:signal transduction histidine kinase